MPAPRFRDIRHTPAAGRGGRGRVVSTLCRVRGKCRAVTRALSGAVAWGVLVAWSFDASLARGALIGLWTWAPAIVLSVHWRDVPVDDPPRHALGL